MRFVWRARNQEGKLYQGTLQAASQEEAASFVKSNYGCILELKATEVKAWYNWRSFSPWNKLRFTDKERILFFERLAIILTSGIPLVKGLQLLQGQKQGVISRASQKLEIAIAGGGSLAAAMKVYTSLFPPLTVNLVAVGEKSGELCKIFQEIAQYYRKQHELKEFIIKNSLYPVIVLLISLAVLVLFICVILPILAETYQGLGVPLSGMMKFSVVVSEFLLTNLSMVPVVLFITAYLFYRSGSLWRKLFLKIPWVYKIYGGFLEIRFCKLLALLLDCGVNITEAVADVSTTFKDDAFVKQLWILNNMLRRGEDIGLAARCMVKFVSPMTIEMITIGAATGYLPRLLNEAAQISEENTREALDRIKEILGPLLLVITAIIVGTVVASVMGPLFDLVANLPSYV